MVELVFTLLTINLSWSISFFSSVDYGMVVFIWKLLVGE